MTTNEIKTPLMVIDRENLIKRVALNENNTKCKYYMNCTKCLEDSWAPYYWLDMMVAYPTKKVELEDGKVKVNVVVRLDAVDKRYIKKPMKDSRINITLDKNDGAGLDRFISEALVDKYIDFMKTLTWPGDPDTWGKEGYADVAKLENLIPTCFYGEMEGDAQNYITDAYRRFKGNRNSSNNRLDPIPTEPVDVYKWDDNKEKLVNKALEKKDSIIRIININESPKIEEGITENDAHYTLDEFKEDTFKKDWEENCNMYVADNEEYISCADAIKEIYPFEEFLQFCNAEWARLREKIDKENRVKDMLDGADIDDDYQDAFYEILNDILVEGKTESEYKWFSFNTGIWEEDLATKETEKFELVTADLRVEKCEDGEYYVEINPTDILRDWEPPYTYINGNLTARSLNDALSVISMHLEKEIIEEYGYERMEWDINDFKKRIEEGEKEFDVSYYALGDYESIDWENVISYYDLEDTLKYDEYEDKIIAVEK